MVRPDVIDNDHFFEDMNIFIILINIYIIDDIKMMIYYL